MAASLFEKDRTEHQATVGFAQANIELYPDLAWQENPDPLPVQVIFTNGQMRTIRFQVEKGEKVKDSAQRYAADVHALTSTYLHELSCDQIEQLINEEVLALVYFGSHENLDKGGEMNYLHTLTTLDRFKYPQEPILFFYNTDDECKRRRSLTVNEHSLVLYVDEKTLPFVAQGPDFDLSPMNILNWVTTCIAEAKM